MHYYKRHIGDYHRKAGRLSILQHGIYCLLIDACYDKEDFPKNVEEAIDWVWASNQDEREAVSFVLEKFFTKTGKKYIQNHIKEDLDAYHSRASQNAKNGKKGGRPKKTDTPKEKTQSVSDENQIALFEKPNHKPLTKNQEPIEKDKQKRASKISQDWMPDDDLIKSIAEKHSCSQKAVRNEVYNFVNYWIGEGKTKKDWNATFRNWCAKDYCPIHNSKGRPMLETMADAPDLKNEYGKGW